MFSYWHHHLSCEFETRSWRGVLNTLCDKACQWLETGQWFSPGTPVTSTNNINCHDISEILLKVTLKTINQTTNLIRDGPFNLKGGLWFFSKKIFWFSVLLKKIFWFWWRKKKIIWFRVFVILPNVKFWKKINILTRVLSEKKILNETKNHNPPL